MERRWMVVGLLAVTLAATACSTTPRRPGVEAPLPPDAVPSGREEGVASWYGPGFHGKATASGETYDQWGMTAAHRTLPLGTWVRVTHLGTGEQITVRINDRGPYAKGRILDLSRAAAERLAVVGPGTALVRVEPLLRPGERLRTVAYAVQIGAYQDAASAEAMREKVDRAVGTAYVATTRRAGAPVFRVRLGPFASPADAERVEATAEQRGFPAYVVEETR